MNRVDWNPKTGRFEGEGVDLSPADVLTMVDDLLTAKEWKGMTERERRNYLEAAREENDRAFEAETGRHPEVEI